MARTATTDEIGWAERVLIACFSNSAVGVAVVGDNLLCMAINTSLAAMHNHSPNVQLGMSLREVLGEAGSQLETAVRQVLASWRPVINVHITGELTDKSGVGRWVGSLLPLTDEKRVVTRVGVILVKVAPQIGPKQAGPRAYPCSSRVALQSWREIADYMRASVKTVQRWERIHGFPVRRLEVRRGAMVFALRDEVDNWVRSKARLATPLALEKRPAT
jgi:PAS fold